MFLASGLCTSSTAAQPLVFCGARPEGGAASQGTRLTQQQLAEQLGVAQQTLAHYEGARLRVPASMLPQLAQILGVPVDVLIGQPVKATPAKRGRSPKWQQQMEAIAQLPKARQRFVSEMLETVLAQR